jgi:CelD/BcsL family acetyltransferase involved in cellulose biosynthesis
MAFLRLDGQAIAFDYCLECNNVHYLLKTGYDPDFSAQGPGMILRSLMLERAFSIDIVTYEFLGTVQGFNNRWKLDWTEEWRERCRLLAFAPSVAGRFDWAVFAAGLPVAHGARGLARDILGPTGRHVVKRGIHLLQSSLRR